MQESAQPTRPLWRPQPARSGYQVLLLVPRNQSLHARLRRVMTQAALKAMVDNKMNELKMTDEAICKTVQVYSDLVERTRILLAQMLAADLSAIDAALLHSLRKRKIEPPISSVAQLSVARVNNLLRHPLALSNEQISGLHSLPVHHYEHVRRALHRARTVLDSLNGQAHSIQQLFHLTTRSVDKTKVCRILTDSPVFREPCENNKAGEGCRDDKHILAIVRRGEWVEWQQIVLFFGRIWVEVCSHREERKHPCPVTGWLPMTDFTASLSVSVVPDTRSETAEQYEADQLLVNIALYQECVEQERTKTRDNRGATSTDNCLRKHVTDLETAAEDSITEDLAHGRNSDEAAAAGGEVEACVRQQHVEVEKVSETALGESLEIQETAKEPVKKAMGISKAQTGITHETKVIDNLQKNRLRRIDSESAGMAKLAMASTNSEPQNMKNDFLSSPTEPKPQPHAAKSILAQHPPANKTDRINSPPANTGSKPATSLSTRQHRYFPFRALALLAKRRSGNLESMPFTCLEEDRDDQNSTASITGDDDKLTNGISDKSQKHRDPDQCVDPTSQFTSVVAVQEWLEKNAIRGGVGQSHFSWDVRDLFKELCARACVLTFEPGLGAIRVVRILRVKMWDTQMERLLVERGSQRPLITCKVQPGTDPFERMLELVQKELLLLFPSRDWVPLGFQETTTEVEDSQKYPGLQTKYVIVNFEGRIDAAQMQHADFTVCGKKNKLRGWQSLHEVWRILRVLKDDTLRLPQAKKDQATPGRRFSIHSIVCAKKVAGGVSQLRQDVAAAGADEARTTATTKRPCAENLSAPAGNTSKGWDWLNRGDHDSTGMRSNETVLSLKLQGLAQRHMRPMTSLLLILILPLLADSLPIRYFIKLSWTLHLETVGFLSLLLLLVGWAATRLVLNEVQRRGVRTEGDQGDRSADRSRRCWENLPASLGLRHASEFSGDQNVESTQANKNNGGFVSQWLDAHGVDISKFGQGGHKTLGSLKEELLNGECTLVCPDRLQSTQANRRFQQSGPSTIGVGTTGSIGHGATGSKMKVIREIRVAKVEIVREQQLVAGQQVQLLPTKKGAHSVAIPVTVEEVSVNGSVRLRRLHPQSSHRQRKENGGIGDIIVPLEERFRRIRAPIDSPADDQPNCEFNGDMLVTTHELVIRSDPKEGDKSCMKIDFQTLAENFKHGERQLEAVLRGIAFKLGGKYVADSHNQNQGHVHLPACVSVVSMQPPYKEVEVSRHYPGVETHKDIYRIVMVVRGLPAGTFVTVATDKGSVDRREQSRRLLFWDWRPRSEVEKHREQLIAKVRWQLWAADTSGFFEKMVAEVVHTVTRRDVFDRVVDSSSGSVPQTLPTTGKNVHHVLAQYLPIGMSLDSAIAAAYGGEILQWQLGWFSSTHLSILGRILELLQVRVPMARLPSLAQAKRMTVYELAAWLERAVIWGDNFNNHNFGCTQEQTLVLEQQVQGQKGLERMIKNHWEQQQSALQQYLLQAAEGNDSRTAALLLQLPPVGTGRSVMSLVLQFLRGDYRQYMQVLTHTPWHLEQSNESTDALSPSVNETKGTDRIYRGINSHAQLPLRHRSFSVKGTSTVQSDSDIFRSWHLEGTGVRNTYQYPGSQFDSTTRTTSTAKLRVQSAQVRKERSSTCTNTVIIKDAPVAQNATYPTRPAQPFNWRRSCVLYKIPFPDRWNQSQIAVCPTESDELTTSGKTNNRDAGQLSIRRHLARRMSKDLQSARCVCRLWQAAGGEGALWSLQLPRLVGGQTDSDLNRFTKPLELQPDSLITSLVPETSGSRVCPIEVAARLGQQNKQVVHLFLRHLLGDRRLHLPLCGMEGVAASSQVSTSPVRILEYAALVDDASLVRFLLQEGADPEQVDLHKCVERNCYQALRILLPLTCIGTEIHSASTTSLLSPTGNPSQFQASAPASNFGSLVQLARDRLRIKSLQPRILGLLLQRLEPSPSEHYADCLVEYLRAVLLEGTGIGDGKENIRIVRMQSEGNDNTGLYSFRQLTCFIEGCRFPMHTLLHCSYRLREEAAKRDIQFPSLRAHNPLSLHADALEDEAVRLLGECVGEGESECLLSEQASLERGQGSSCFQLAVRLAMRKVVAHQHFQAGYQRLWFSARGDATGASVRRFFNRVFGSQPQPTTSSRNQGNSSGSDLLVDSHFSELLYSQMQSLLLMLLLILVVLPLICAAQLSSSARRCARDLGYGKGYGYAAGGKGGQDAEVVGKDESDGLVSSPQADPDTYTQTDDAVVEAEEDCGASEVSCAYFKLTSHTYCDILLVLLLWCVANEGGGLADTPNDLGIDISDGSEGFTGPYWNQYANLRRFSECEQWLVLLVAAYAYALYGLAASHAHIHRLKGSLQHYGFQPLSKSSAQRIENSALQMGWVSRFLQEEWHDVLMVVTFALSLMCKLFAIQEATDSLSLGAPSARLPEGHEHLVPLPGLYDLAPECPCDSELWSLHSLLLSGAALLTVLRLTKLFSIHPRLGPMWISVNKMLSDVSVFAVLLFVCIAAFAFSLTYLLRTVSAHPASSVDERTSPQFQSVSRSFTTLLWASFGVGLERELVDSDGTAWYASAVLFVFMFSSIIMLTNLLIAMMSTTYEKVKDHADVEYKFALVQLIDRSNSLPLVPPPLNLCVLPFALLGSLLRIFRSHENRFIARKWNRSEKSKRSIASLRLKQIREITLLRRQQQFEENEKKRMVRESLMKRAYTRP